MSIETLGQYLVTVEDPRCSGKVEHRLVEVLVIAVCAVIACAESWDDIALYGRSKLAWLRTFLELSNGIPSHDTFRRVFTLIDPDAFEAGFAKWVGSLANRFEREVAAIDGKTVRRSFDRGREQSALHVVSAWASEQGLVLGHSRKRKRFGDAAWTASRTRRNRLVCGCDHGHSRASGSACAGEQHRHPGRHGVPDRNRREDPGARG